MGVGGVVHMYDIVLESSRSLSHLLMLLSIDNNAVTYAVSLPNRQRGQDVECRTSPTADVAYVDNTYSSSCVTSCCISYNWRPMLA